MPITAKRRDGSSVSKNAPPVSNSPRPEASQAVGAAPRALAPRAAPAKPKAAKGAVKPADGKAAASGADMAKVSDPKATGRELIDEMIKEPSLDVFLDRHPDTMAPKDFLNLVVMLRGARARFTEKRAAKKEKKEDANAD